MPSVLAPISSISSQYPLHPGSLNQDKWGGLDQPQPGHDLSDISASGDRAHNFDMNRYSMARWRGLYITESSTLTRLEFL